MDDVPTIIKTNMGSCLLVILLSSCLTCLTATSMTTSKAVLSWMDSPWPTSSGKINRTRPSYGKPTTPVLHNATSPTVSPTVVQNHTTPKATELPPATTFRSRSTEATTSKATTLTSGTIFFPPNETSSVSNVTALDPDLVPVEPNATTAVLTSNAFDTSTEITKNPDDTRPGEEPACVAKVCSPNVPTEEENDKLLLSTVLSIWKSVKRITHCRN